MHCYDIHMHAALSLVHYTEDGVDRVVANYYGICGCSY